MSDAKIGHSGTPTNLGIPAGFFAQMASHDPMSDAKFYLIAGSTFTRVLRPLPGHRFYLVRTPDYHFGVVSPTVFPFYFMAEYPTEIKVFVMSGPLMEPQEILQEVTRKGHRRDILYVLKDLAKNDSPVPLHEIDLLEVASRIADGTLKLPPKENP